MDIIMQNKGLAMRKTGNVIMVAPAEEIATKEKAQLEANNAIEDLKKAEYYIKREILKRSKFGECGK